MYDSDAAYWQRMAQDAREQVSVLKQALEQSEKCYWTLLEHVASLKAMQLPSVLIPANQFLHAPDKPTQEQEKT